MLRIRHAHVRAVVRSSTKTGNATDRMREHYSTVNADETRDIGQRVASLVPAVGLKRGG